MNEQYQLLVKKLWDRIEKEKIMVLGTSLHNEVTARSISVALFKEKLYFTTFKDSTKYTQMKENGNVALCVNDIQITGTANFLGHPLDESNHEVAEVFRSVFEEWFQQYNTLPKAEFIEINLKKAAFYTDEGEENSGYIIDFINQTAVKF